MDRHSVFSITIPVRWGDMDANGHVNNAVFATYFEQARIAWFDGICAQRHEDSHQHVVARFICNYRKPITYPATVTVSVMPGQPGRTSFPLIQEIRSADDPHEIFADAEVIMVRIDHASGKSQALADWLRALITV